MSNNILFASVNQFVGNARGVNERSKIIGANIARLRKDRGWSQAELAKKIDVRQNTIATIETGKTKRSSYLPDIARALKVSLADIDPQLDGEETLVMSDALVMGDNDIELHNSVEAGDGALVLSEPIGMVRRPQTLVSVKGAYAVQVVGESMIPAVRPGDVVLVNPHLLPRRGDLCLFILDLDGEFRATIKEYCGHTANDWKVRRYGPKTKDFTLAKKEWPKCHVVVSINKVR